MREFLNQWMPIDASAHGHQVDDLIVLTHWLMAVLFVVWGAYFLFVLYRFNSRRHPRADHVGARTHVSTYGELGVAVVEVVLLAGLSIPAWYKWTHLPQKDKNPFEVRVVAEQFAWNVHYPGPDGVFGRSDPKLMTSTNPLGLDPKDPNAKDDVVTMNNLHLPVNRAAVIHITSKDVIHSFKLPVMRSEQDAIPGMDVPIHFTPVKTNDDGDRWEIACAQLCGLGHYRMRGQLFVHGAAEFQKWMSTAPTAFSTQ